jgi:hypothetical protein
MGEPAAGEPVDLFLPANTARHHVGISVGIGSNTRRNLLEIQMVIGLDATGQGHHLAASAGKSTSTIRTKQ